jgi:hypothetical protein
MAATAAAAIGVAVAVSGCGATSAISGEVDPVAKAATTTAHAPGYRMSATIDATSGGATVHATMAGVFDTAHHTGAFTQRESVAGQTISIAERLSGTTVYMRLPEQSGLDHVTGGKPWVKLDFSRTLGAEGLGGLPTQGTDPTQFLDYLRTVGAKTTKLGTATVNGVQTTHYHVLINLDNYPNLFPPSRRATATRGVASMERLIGTHILPMDAWVDSGNLLRRMSFSFGECVNSQHLNMAMSMNLSGYGPQTVPAAPPSSRTYDLTPLIVSSVKKLTQGACGATA